MTRQLAAWINQAAGAIGEFIDKARRSGDLRRFFADTLDVVKELGGIFKSLGEIIIGVFKAAKPMGDTILAGLNDELAKLADWVSSAAGQNKLRQYFEDAMPLAKAVYDLVIAVAGVFLDLTQQKPGSGLVDFLNTLRTDLLPKIKTMVESTTEALGPALLTTVEAIADVFIQLGGSSGPIVIFVEALGKMAEAIGWLIENVPGFKEFVITFGAFMAIVKAVKLTGVVTGISGLATGIGRLNASSPGLVAKTGPVVGLTGLGATSGKLTGLGGKLKSIVGGMTGMGPIGLAVGAGLIAAGFGLKAVYDRSPEFRDAVDDLKTKLSELGDAIGPALADLGPALADVVDGMTYALDGVIAVVGAFGDIWNAIPGPIKTAMEWMLRLGNPIGQVITLFQYLREAVELTKGVFSTIGDWIGSSMDALSGVVGQFKDIGNGIKNAFQGALNWVRDNWKKIVGIITGPLGLIATNSFGMRDKVVGAFKAIKEAVTNAANWIKTKAGDIASFVKGIPGKLGNVGQLIWNKLKGGWNEVWTWVKGKGSDLVTWFKDIPGRIGDFAGVAAEVDRGPVQVGVEHGCAADQQDPGDRPARLRPDRDPGSADSGGAWRPDPWRPQGPGFGSCDAYSRRGGADRAADRQCRRARGAQGGRRARLRQGRRSCRARATTTPARRS